MNIERVFSVAGKAVREQVSWRSATAKITDGKTGQVIFEATVEVPANWSETAANILAQKYLRKAGVPQGALDGVPNGGLDGVPVVAGMPPWLYPRQFDPGIPTGAETSAHQTFHRMVGCWTYHAWIEGLLTEEEQAQIFYDEMYLMLARQMAAPNSPQWFNTGLHWAYGISAEAQGGHWATDLVAGAGSEEAEPYEVANAYERPQPSACFIQSLADDLVREGGIMDLWTRESRLFKYGSGSGSNMSVLRGANEELSGGGRSSGMMSFLRVGDRAAGAIKSGGTTRRAALMRCVDPDHPEIEAFVNWKRQEEEKAAAIAVGSRVIKGHLEAIYNAGDLLGENAWRALLGARASGVPEALIERVIQDRRDGRPFDWKVYELGFESEAMETVSGQNANNSVRIPDRFLAAVDADAPWDLIARTTDKTVKTISAPGLWRQICENAWACADPGVQFDTTINAWHTCPEDGRINASNPCSEYMFLDDTACNLASLRLGAFLRPDGTLDLDGYIHAVRLWTMALEVSVYMASYPSKEIARRSHAYRTLGLGYADAGGLLMRMGLAYDSDEGRALIAGLTALLTGVAYRTSAEMADLLGPFPRYQANAEAMRRVMRNHARAFGMVFTEGYEGLNIEPMRYAGTDLGLYPKLTERLSAIWWAVIHAKHFRNAQTSLIAPTGTIALVMDCGDSTGIEPDFGLIKQKNLAGGGTINFVINHRIAEALRRLGYSASDAKRIVEYIEEHGELPAKDPAHPEVRPFINEDHMAVFDCAVPASPGGRCLRWEAHVLMMAAVQPFLSGAISKTVNLPHDATVADVTAAYRLAHKLGLKSVALYRDGCKLEQPLSVGEKPKVEHVVTSQRPFLVEREHIRSGSDAPRLALAGVEVAPPAPTRPGLGLGTAAQPSLPRGVREYLPWRREGGTTQKVKIGDAGQSVFVTTNHYADGRPAEVFIELAHEGSTLRASFNLVGVMMSLALQYGAPVKEVVDRLVHMKFEPAGIVEGHERIKMCTSIADYIGRDLGIIYLGRDDLAHIQIAKSVETGQAVVALNVQAVGLAQHGYTGEICPNCHNATLYPAGTCKNCKTCGITTGCS